MNVRLPAALFAIVFGMLETAGGVQEFVVKGVSQSQTEPLMIGTLGTIAGVFLTAAGIALLVRGRLIGVLVRSTLYISVPVFLVAGVVKHYAGWPITAVGILYPLFLFLLYRDDSQSEQALSKA